MGEVFLVYVRQFLAPELKLGDIVVMDNLAGHKVAGVWAVHAWRRCGDLLGGPPWSRRTPT